MIVPEGSLSSRSASALRPRARTAAEIRVRLRVHQLLTLRARGHRPGEAMLQELNRWLRRQGWKEITERQFYRDVRDADAVMAATEAVTAAEVWLSIEDLCLQNQALVDDPNADPVERGVARRELRELITLKAKILGMIETRGGVAVQVNVQTNQVVPYQPGTEEAASKATAIMDIVNPDE